MSNTSSLQSMPVDFFRQLTPWIPCGALTRLWMCGSKALLNRLGADGGIPELRYVHTNTSPTIPWPTLLAHCPHLLSLSISANRTYRVPVLHGAKSAILPASLRKLEIRASGADALFASDSAPGVLDSGLSERFPYLEELVLQATSGDSWIGGNMDGLPRTLRVLEFGSLVARPDFSLNLPALEAFYVRSHCDVGTGALRKLPATLKTLKLECETKMRAPDFQSLPAHLTYLHVFGAAQLTDEMLKYLPPSLQVLILESEGFHANSAKLLPLSLTTLRLACNTTFTNASVAAMPCKNLTRLELPANTNISTEAIVDLPQSMKFLSLPSANLNDAAAELLPRDLTGLNVASVANLGDEFLQHLPPKLTFLDTWFMEGFSDHGIAGLPRGLVTFNMGASELITDKSAALLPRTLTELFSYCEFGWTDKAIKELPRGLLSLSLPMLHSLTSQCIRDLPRGLTSFVCPHSDNIGIDCLRDLPPSLTRLVLHQTQVSEAYFKEINRYT